MSTYQGNKGSKKTHIHLPQGLLGLLVVNLAQVIAKARPGLLNMALSHHSVAIHPQAVVVGGVAGRAHLSVSMSLVL